MKSEAPKGWEEVFSGTCLEADLVEAVLEANGLKAVKNQFSPMVWWSGSVMEDCRVYVPVHQAGRAREILVERREDA